MKIFYKIVDTNACLYLLTDEQSSTMKGGYSE